MKKFFTILFGTIVLLLVAWGVYYFAHPKNTEPATQTNTQTNQNNTASSYITTSGNSDIIKLDTINSGDHVSSPLTVNGQARGNWYFEATFPVKLMDGNSNVIASGAAQAQGDWMTTNYVPFTVQLTFPTPTTSTGTLILIKDNPSGLPANDDQLQIPVTF